ncbi:checkpoint clamp complex protein Rad1 [Didymella pomorum]|uniref:Checkpoint clamp complex protein Rad1 n=1 Tax=Didymella pomorum TaxID=749634 RepID=A0A9W9D654_9PLEO|nr:checkpoint clamp complex protein Rad1 [Didymella pomorum]
MKDEPPVLTAVSSSARQLFTLLRCIAFASKAHVILSEEGLKFSVDEASVMEASAFLDKALFTTFNFHPPSIPPSSADSDDEDATPPLTFHISLTALLETLQIFGLTDPNTSKPPWARDNPYPTSTAFNSVLGMNNLCRITYDTPGAPLSIILTEASVRTSCDLTTYEPEYTDEIPFDRQNLAFKTIMRGSWLYDAIVELSSTSPDKLTMYAKMVRGKPFFALSSTGTLGSARVEFNNQPPRSSFRAAAMNEDANAPPANLLETFQLSDGTTLLRQSYKYTYIQKAARAMSVASKVSVRVDAQGVLSMQFMIEVDPAAGGGTSKVSFVDFRFVPLVDDEDEGGDEGETFMQNGDGDDRDDGYDAF